MASASIMKELSRNAIPVRNWPLFIDRWTGRKDYTFSQMSITPDGFITTPWINSKYESLSE